MGALFRPFIYGVIAAIVCYLGLWLAIPMLLLPYIPSIAGWYMGLLNVVPLLVGGFVSTRYMKSKYLSRYLFMGAFVGITVASLNMLVTTVSGHLWFLVIFIAAGGAISVFGAYIGWRKSIST